MKFLCVGNVSIDKVIMRGKVHFPVIGGGSTYMASFLRIFSPDVYIMTNLGKDLPEIFRKFLFGNFKMVYSEEVESTTSFLLNYESFGSRKLEVLEKGEKINVRGDVEAFDTILVSPIAGELSLEDLRILSERGEVIALDLQGFLRKFEGNSVKFEWPGYDFGDVKVDFIKVSEEELIKTLGKKGIEDYFSYLWETFSIEKFAAITLGKKGSTAFDGKKYYHKEGYVVEDVVNTTGCGDVFLSALVYSFERSMDIEYSLDYANAAASISSQFFDPIEILENSEYIKHRIYEMVGGVCPS
ncbi:MAG: PfkB family carbohydrate kinase [Candidatus Asgardarchaeia archaeon]